MGDSTVLRSKESKHYNKFMNRDINTTTNKYGFRLTGFTLYRKDNNSYEI